MNRFFKSFSSLSFWRTIFEAIRIMAAIQYLRILSEQDNRLVFWIVVVAFIFDPAVQAFQSIRGKANH